MKNVIMNGKDTFELVDSIPCGYEIWLIGKNMIDGYLPLCQADSKRCINSNTLKAIKSDLAQEILSLHLSNVKSMERYVKRYSDLNPGTRGYRTVKKIQEVLPEMRKLSGIN